MSRLKVHTMIENPVWSHNQWTPDGKAITYKTINNGIDQIFNQPLDGGEPQVLVSQQIRSRKH